MKIELKRDDPSLKDITVEIEAGDYISQSDWRRPKDVTVLELVRFYDEWIGVANSVKAFASLKKSAKSLLKHIEELATYHDDDPVDYLGGGDDDQV